MQLKIIDEYIQGPLYNKDLVLRRNQGQRIIEPSWPPERDHVFVCIEEFHTHHSARVVSNKETFDNLSSKKSRWYVLPVKAINQGGTTEEFPI